MGKINVFWHSQRHLLSFDSLKKKEFYIYTIACIHLPNHNLKDSMPTGKNIRFLIFWWSWGKQLFFFFGRARGLSLSFSSNATHLKRHFLSFDKELTAVPSGATRELVTGSNGCSGIRGGREGLGMCVATGQSSSCGTSWFPSCGTLERETTRTTSGRGACQHTSMAIKYLDIVTWWP
jgi:hypothetical protein